MKYKILLVCAGGFSTTMIVEEINEVLDESDKFKKDEFHLEAISVDRIEAYLDEYNIILVGPQLGHKYEYIREIIGDREIGITLLTKELYGEMDGEKILRKAIEIGNEYI
ncbi:MAG: PTS sugar transporter subunit IIB [Clostridium sp.]|uniref:PTS sugar transporter subunit IIB n=1 Tax=Clostridium sp. TaxID=1506 RepID=UPI003F2AC348